MIRIFLWVHLVQYQASFGIPLWERVDLITFNCFSTCGLWNVRGLVLFTLKREMWTTRASKNLLWGRPLRRYSSADQGGVQLFFHWTPIVWLFWKTTTWQVLLLTLLRFSLGKVSIWSLEQLPQFTIIQCLLWTFC